MFSRSQFLLNGSVWQWTRGTSKEILYEPRINSLPVPFAVPWSKFLSEHAWGRTAIWFGEGLRCTTSTSATCSPFSPLCVHVTALQCRTLYEGK
ncbi:hypothetical protein ANCCAN_25678 [Ancylostoma caninum]|uniref:Uncharacterized protein n=1 Tax=Ancylostoma caninum TaxID=29170 RepID=A0A368F8V1_ANCCA|nr:hypothetical protein ANCCAN_25678 [Ancylostoma caninum]